MGRISPVRIGLLSFFVVLSSLFAGILIQSWTLSISTNATTIGVAPNPSGTTFIDQDTEWSGTLLAGGDIVIGNSSQPISVVWHNCTLEVSGSVYVDSLPTGFKPIRLEIDRCEVTLGLSSSRILLDHSDPSVSGVAEGSSILVSNSTFRSAFQNPVDFPSGFLLRSGTSAYNLARVQMENTTFINIGDYWGDNLAAIHTRLSSTAYSRFTPDSYLRGLAFQYPKEGMGGNAVAVILGDSMPIENSVFNGGFMGSGFGKYIYGNTFNDTCRPIYDPIDDAIVSYNTIYGDYCKTVDFFHPRATFSNNILYDSIGPTFDGSGDDGRAFDNVFIRSRIVINFKSGIEVRNNSFYGITSQSGEAVIWDRGTGNLIVGNQISDVPAGGVQVHPHPNDSSIYQNPVIWNNTVVGYSLLGPSYPGVRVARATGASVLGNVLLNGPVGIYLEEVSDSTFESNTATGVVVGLELRNSNNIVFRNGTYEASVSGIVLGGGNTDIRFVSVQYSSLSFAEENDVFQYYEYLDVIMPTGNETSLIIRDNSGAPVYASPLAGDLFSNVELHLFNETKYSRTSFNPFTFEVSGLQPNKSYSISKNGVSSHSLTSTAEGTLAFQEDINVRTWIRLQEEPTEPDREPPSQVDDLQAVKVGTDYAIIQWTAPGDDGNVGQATAYDLRYSMTGPLVETNFDSGLFVPIKGPSPPGTTEILNVTGLTPETAYWFALRTADEVPNWSPVSNSVEVRSSQVTFDEVVPPRIESIWYTPSESALDVIFSSPMNRTAVEESLSFDPEVSFLARWQTASHLRIVFQTDLDEGVSYLLVIDTTATDLEGKPLAGSFSFRFFGVAAAEESPGLLNLWLWAAVLLAAWWITALVLYFRSHRRLIFFQGITGKMASRLRWTRGHNSGASEAESLLQDFEDK